MSSHPDLKETPSLLVTALRQFTLLMQDEVALAKAELSRNISRAGVGLALIGVAALLALTALNVLTGALVGYLAATSVSTEAAALIVGGGLLAVAIVLAVLGRARLGSAALMPDRTVDSLSEDFKAMKGATDA